LHRSIYPSTDTLPQYIEFFNILIHHFLTQDPAISRIEILRATIENSDDKVLKQGFADFLGHTNFKNLFTETTENLNILKSHSIINIDLSELSTNPLLLESYVGLLFAKLQMLLDLSPTIICSDGFEQLFNIKYFTPALPAWLDKVRNNNGLALMSTLRNEKLETTDIFKESMRSFGTKLLFSNKFVDKYFRKHMDLTEGELNHLKSYEGKRRIVLFKQNDFSVPIQLDLSFAEDEVKILSLGKKQ
jgi:type IV secretory pathway VirB4 component